MIIQDDLDTVKFLTRLNELIGKQEFDGNRAFFQECLSDNLIFRRASGLIVGKQAFLDGLKPNQFVMLEPLVERVKVDLDSAVVDVVVKAERHGHAQGEFRNIRLFTKQAEGWELAVWINTPIQG